ncbi:hypothetical protein ACFLTP_05925 [Chloroflexota bacterium]
MSEETSRLIYSWYNEKANFEGFLKDPLEWIASELENKLDTDKYKVLTDMIRFVNSNRKLLTPTH